MALARGGGQPSGAERLAAWLAPPLGRIGSRCRWAVRARLEGLIPSSAAMSGRVRCRSRYWPQPPFVDLHPRRPARWWDRDAIVLQGAPEGVLADMGFGPDGPQGASFVDNELLKSFPGELCGERVSPRRLTPGRSQPEDGAGVVVSEVARGRG